MRAALALCLTATLLACGGDKKPATSPPRLRLTALRLVDQSPEAIRPIAPKQAWLEAALREALEAARIDVEGEGAGWLGQLEGRIVYGGRGPEGLSAQGAPLAVLSLQVRLKIPGERVGTLLLVEGREALEGAVVEGESLKRAIRAAQRRAVEALAQQIDLLQGERAGLIKALADADPALRGLAIERLTALGDRDAVPDLIARLKDEPVRDLRFRLIGALSELDDARAIDPLIDAVDLGDRAHLRATIDALATLGGPRVSDFFDLLTSHDDPAIRQMVEAAQARMTAVASRP
ncbi:HEAT repeat domain-containing protein [Myxococcota bacterium]|nr:HEAT repeat domain-containing protein [Myxococcota bacterium]MBU1430335.1 HEAT repeat domain-containing protein [Myxococcota bacterium]MBU1896392.1 HEAT repeat domain-containing protein [Myxococcota bacterium]